MITPAQTKPVTIDILGNDTDIDSTIDPVTIAIANNPTNGNILINPDGTVTHTPNSTFVATDTFTYTVKDRDRLQSDTATVTVRINNLAPIV